MAGEAGLDAATRTLVRLSAALAVSDAPAWRDALAAAASHASRTEIEETLLQAHLFVGFPAVLNALIEWRKLEGEEAAARRTGAARDARGGDVNAAVDGERLCRAVYGRGYEKLRRNVRRLSPDLDRWIVEDGYGKTLSRPGLSVETRELCIVALLAAGGHDRQLRAHLHGALNVGCAPDRVEAALRHGVRAAGAARGRGTDPARLWRIWEEVVDRVEKKLCSST
ncbi:carboxymuconolactone decarboxylase family protein [Candidatus Palauibacter sp.]|uniref:carboxymuconolactone decarboxylase family protein n=1 Tax=Candidatus Palauibacter sp. TaxID=3101350 RepID=UPI003B5AE57D